MQRTLELAADLMSRKPPLDDLTVYRELVSGGVDEETASWVVIFVPFAFCRDMLDSTGVTFASSYSLIDTPVSFPLEEEPLYRAARELAHRYAGEAKGAEFWLSLSGRSHEFHAIHELVGQGSRFEDLVLSEPIFNPKFFPAAAQARDASTEE